MKNLVGLFLFLFSLNSFAKVECSRFSAQGMLRSENENYFLVLHENTLSENKIQINQEIAREIKLLVDLRVSLVFKMIKSDKKLLITEIEKKQLAAVDPLVKKDSIISECK